MTRAGGVQCDRAGRQRAHAVRGRAGGGGEWWSRTKKRLVLAGAGSSWGADERGAAAKRKSGRGGRGAIAAAGTRSEWSRLRSRSGRQAGAAGRAEDMSWGEGGRGLQSSLPRRRLNDDGSALHRQTQDGPTGAGAAQWACRGATGAQRAAGGLDVCATLGMEVEVEVRRSKARGRGEGSARAKAVAN